jgi:hypothetical protein
MQLCRSTRREFLKTAGAIAAASPVAAAARPRDFEVSASLYAWDLHDEGVERVLDNLQEMASVNSVYLVGLMHPEKRPLTQAAFPHNPVRSTWVAEDARVYWHPDRKEYSRIQPRLSDHQWLSRTDWLDALTQAARKRGIKTGVEVSHAVLDMERAQGEFASCTQRNIRGEPPRAFPWVRPVCPNNQVARRYVVELFRDLVANHDVDYAQSCIMAFEQGGAERGGCFCESCREAARKAGIDFDRIRAALLADPKAQPELTQWQAFRYESVRQFYELIHDHVHRRRPAIDFRYNIHSSNPLGSGVNVPLMKPHLDSVRVMDYSEQTGNPAAMAAKRQRLATVRRELGDRFPILSAVAVRPKATPELIRTGVQIAVECGMDGITLGHYDGAEFPMLRAIREGLATAGMRPG